MGGNRNSANGKCNNFPQGKARGKNIAGEHRSILLFPKQWKIGILALCSHSVPFNVSIFDLIILAILAALTLRGIWKGMVSQIVSVASYFVCWIVATRFGGLIAPAIPVEAPWNQVLAMAIVFLITLVAIRFAYAALEKLIKHWHLEKLNKLFGGLLGFTKGFLLCLIITFFAVMFSETSRAVVFNSTTGIHLVQLITRISLFVPKDSYEFVHTQFAQFQDKVCEAVPGQAPETLQIQQSEIVQQMLGHLQQTKGEQMKGEQAAVKSNTASLWTALSKWWKGSNDDTPETATAVASSLQSPLQNGHRSSLATTYTPPLQQALPQQPLSQQNNTHTNFPQLAAPQHTIAADAVEEFFIGRETNTFPTQPTTAAAQPQLTALSPIPDISAPRSSSSLTPLAPLTELLPAQEESVQLLPASSIRHHVGSDRLLRNSTQSTTSNTPARVFRHQ
jgi:membrane protein required for colicin V production